MLGRGESIESIFSSEVTHNHTQFLSCEKIEFAVRERRAMKQHLNVIPIE